eukprot:SAG31_NODE_5130_length_2724_cov_1.619048_1_plen_176_part_00
MVGHNTSTISTCAAICKPGGTVVAFGIPDVPEYDNFAYLLYFRKNIKLVRSGAQLKVVAVRNTTLHGSRSHLAFPILRSISLRRSRCLNSGGSHSIVSSRTQFHYMKFRWVSNLQVRTATKSSSSLLKCRVYFGVIVAVRPPLLPRGVHKPRLSFPIWTRILPFRYYYILVPRSS